MSGLEVLWRKGMSIPKAKSGATYVADSSIIPTALFVNPSMTISALAERIAFWMIHGREMELG